MEIMDPATGKMIDNDPQPDPNAGGMAGQQQEAAAMSPLPIPPPPAPEAPPAPAMPDLKLPDVSLPAPGQPPVGAGLTPPVLPPINQPGVPQLGADLVPAPIAAGPDGTLAPSAEPPKPIEPADTPEGVTEQEIAERKAKGEEDAQAAKVKAVAAKAILDQKIAAEKGRQDIIKQGEDALASKRVREDAEYEKYRAMGEKDSWGDNGTAKRMLAGIAILLGGRPAAAFVIGAANGFEENKKAGIAQQAEAMKKAGKDVDEVRADMQTKLGNLAQQTAAGLDATAARMDAELAARGVPAEQRATNKDILEIKAKALEKRQSAAIALHKQEESDLKEKLMNNKIMADTDLAKARTDKLNRVPVGKGAGGGGSTDAATSLAKAIETGAQDADGKRRPLTQSEVYAAAKDLGIPPTAKAGRTSVETVMKGSVFNANEARKDAKAGLMDERQTSKEANDWAKQNGLAAVTKKQDELSAVMDELKNAPHNPLGQALAVEKAVSSARGGAASKQALALALNHLGGKWDSIESVIQGVRSGEFGQKQMDNFIGFLNGQLGTAQKEGKDKYDAFNKYADTLPADQRTKAIQSRSRLFSGMAGFGGVGEGSSKSPVVDKSAAAQRVLNDKTAPPAARARAKKYLDENPNAGNITL